MNRSVSGQSSVAALADSKLMMKGDHPVLLQLNSLKQGYDRVQNELHRTSIKLQADYLKASTETDKLHALQHENALLNEELAVLRASPHPSSVPSNHPAVAQVQSLTLSLRKLSDQLTLTESTLHERTTELVKAKSELARVKVQEEKAYELAARIRGREEAAQVKERELQLKLRELEERERMSDLVMKEYASLVRKLEGRASTSSMDSVDSVFGQKKVVPPTTLEVTLEGGRFDLKWVMEGVKDEILGLRARVQELELQNEDLQARVEAQDKATEADREARAKAEWELDKMRTEDSTATKMVSRYMKFSQSQIDALQTSIATLTTRHSTTLSTTQSQLYTLQQTHASTLGSLSRFQSALDELGTDLVRESVGRRAEVEMRVGMVRREEVIREGLGRMRDGLAALLEGEKGVQMEDGVNKVLENVDALLYVLDAPVIVPPTDLADPQPPLGSGTELSASEARLVAVQYVLRQMQGELRREVELSTQMRKTILDLGGEVPGPSRLGMVSDEDEEGGHEVGHGRDEEDPRRESISSSNSTSTLEQQTPGKTLSPLPTALMNALEGSSEPRALSPDARSQAVSAVDSTAVLVSPKAQEANTLLLELEVLELEALGPPSAPTSEVQASTAVSSMAEKPEPVVEQYEAKREEKGEQVLIPPVVVVVEEHEEQTEDIEKEADVKGAQEGQDEEEDDAPKTPTPHNVAIPSVSVSSERVDEKLRLDLSSSSFIASTSSSTITLDTSPAPISEPSTPAAPAPAQAANGPIGRRPSALDLPGVNPLSLPTVVGQAQDASSSGLGLQLDSSEPNSASSGELPTQAPHPLIARLAETAHRYDALQDAFEACRAQLVEIKASLTTSSVTPAVQTLSVPKEVLEAVIERLTDFVEDARVELEVQKSDEALLVKGYETVLVLGAFSHPPPSGLTSPDTLGNASGSRSKSFSNSLASLLSPSVTATLLNSPKTPNASLPMGDVSEERMLAFVEGSEPGVRKAVETFGKKLEDLRHDIRKIRAVAHGEEELEQTDSVEGDGEKVAHEEDRGILYPAPRRPGSSGLTTSAEGPSAEDDSLSVAPSSSSSSSLAPPPNSAPLPSSTSSSNSNTNVSWSSWLIRNATPGSSGSNTPRRSPSPATFGSVMTSPRLRHSPSLTGTLRRPGSAASDRNVSGSSSGSGSTASGVPAHMRTLSSSTSSSTGSVDILANLELRVPMPKFAMAVVPSSQGVPSTREHRSGSSASSAGSVGSRESVGSGPLMQQGMPGQRTRTISTMGMLGFGAGARRHGAGPSIGGLSASRSGSGFLSQQSQQQISSSGSRDDDDAGSFAGPSVAGSRLRSASGGSSGSASARKVAVERDIDGDTDLESDYETGTEGEYETGTEGEETETEGGDSDGDF